MTINETEIRRLEGEISGNKKEIALFESELMSPDSNREGIRKRELELRSKNTKLQRELATLKD